MIIFLRSIHVSVDSRLTRYIQALGAAGKETTTIHWARGGNKNELALKTKLVTFSFMGRLGGGWKNGAALALWMGWCFIVLVINRKNTRTVHAVDLDTALPALLFAKLFGKNFIFDIYDSYGDARSISGPSRRLVDRLERFIARKADFVILPDTCRLPQIPAQVKQVRIIENVPFSAALDRHPSGRVNSAIRRLVYVGILEKSHRGLEDLLSSVSQRPALVELHIAGFGQLAESCVEYAANFPNIHFYGALTPDEALRLMARCDVVVGMYYRTKPHHFRATPNKYYEHLMLGKPLITTAGIPPGIKVSTHKSGWAIEEGTQSILALIDGMTIDECNIRGKNAAAKWDAEYSDYFNTVLVGQYANGICSNPPV